MGKRKRSKHGRWQVGGSPSVLVGTESSEPWRRKNAGIIDGACYGVVEGWVNHMRRGRWKGRIRW